MAGPSHDGARSTFTPLRQQSNERAQAFWKQRRGHASAYTQPIPHTPSAAMRALFYVLNAFRAISISSLACVVAMAVAIMVGASGVQDKHIFYVVSQGFYIIMATALFLSEADMCSSYFDRHIPGLGSAGNPLVLASCQAFLSLSVLQYLDTRFLRMAALRNLAIATGTLLGASAILNMLTVNADSGHSDDSGARARLPNTLCAQQQECGRLERGPASCGCCWCPSAPANASRLPWSRRQESRYLEPPSAAHVPPDFLSGIGTYSTFLVQALTRPPPGAGLLGARCSSRHSTSSLADFAWLCLIISFIVATLLTMREWHWWKHLPFCGNLLIVRTTSPAWRLSAAFRHCVLLP